MLVGMIDDDATLVGKQEIATRRFAGFVMIFGKDNTNTREGDCQS